MQSVDVSSSESTRSPSFLYAVKTRTAPPAELTVCVAVSPLGAHSTVTILSAVAARRNCYRKALAVAVAHRNKVVANKFVVVQRADNYIAKPVGRDRIGKGRRRHVTAQVLTQLSSEQVDGSVSVCKSWSSYVIQNRAPKIYRGGNYRYRRTILKSIYRGLVLVNSSGK